jgi:hypothetical protein
MVEKLVKNLSALAAPLIAGAVLALLALTSGGCGGERTQTVDPDSPDLKKSLLRKYPEMANPPTVKVKSQTRPRR